MAISFGLYLDMIEIFIIGLLTGVPIGFLLYWVSSKPKHEDEEYPDGYFDSCHPDEQG